VGAALVLVPLAGALNAQQPASTGAPAKASEPERSALKGPEAPVGTTLLPPGVDLGNLAAEAEQDFNRQSDPEAVAIVNRYIDAIGGKDTLLAIQDSSTKFVNQKISPTGKTDAEIALYLKRPYKFREEWEIKGFKIKDDPLAFVQIFNGEMQEGWVQMFGTVSPLEGKTLQVFVWDKDIDSSFLHWEDDGYSLRKLGEGLVNDEPADIVEMTDLSGRSKIRLFFSKAEDPEKNGLLLKKEWFDTTQKETSKKEQYFDTYRRIKFNDGSGRSVRFSLRHEIRVDGDTDTERIYTVVKFNSGLSEKLFEKPEGKPFTGAITGSGPKIDPGSEVRHGERTPTGASGTAAEKPSTPTTAAGAAGSRTRGPGVSAATPAATPPEGAPKP
jgi:hypothetical protein